MRGMRLPQSRVPEQTGVSDGCVLARRVPAADLGNGLRFWHVATHWIRPRSAVEQVASMARPSAQRTRVNFRLLSCRGGLALVEYESKFTEAVTDSVKKTDPSTLKDPVYELGENVAVLEANVDLRPMDIGELENPIYQCSTAPAETSART